MERTLGLHNILKCGWRDVAFAVAISNLAKKSSGIVDCRTLR
jgi:hypothetical protein